MPMVRHRAKVDLIRGVRSEDWKPWEGNGPARGEWYSLVDSLRTSLVQNGQNLEFDLEEVGDLLLTQ
jgi:hypothetical protein